MNTDGKNSKQNYSKSNTTIYKKDNTSCMTKWGSPQECKAGLPFKIQCSSY